MRKKKQILVIVFLSFSLILAGCTKTSRYSHFSEEDKSLSWETERERSFGDSDYSNLKTEEEVFSLLKDKYSLSIPMYYEDTKAMFDKMIPSETVKAGETKYLVSTRNKDLEFQTLYTFYKEKELQIIVETKLNYHYSIDQKRAYLKSQIVNVKIAPVSGKLPNDNLSELINEIGMSMKLPVKTVTDGLAGYEKKVKETTQPITDDYLPIISNTAGLKTSEGFLKEVAVVYDPDGTVREIYGEISDQM